MSVSNKKLHTELGKPNLVDFKFLIDPDNLVRMVDIECGYYMCCIGGLLSTYAPSRTGEAVMALRTQLLKYSREEIAERKRAIAVNSQLRTDIEWYLPRNAMVMVSCTA